MRPDEPREQAPSPRRRRAGPVLGALAAGLAGGALALGGAALTGNLGGETVVRDSTPLPAAQAAAPVAAAAPAAPGSVQVVVARSAPSVVTVTTGSRESPERLGSGFLVDRRGRILTNAHVIGESRRATVTFEDGTEETAEVLGRDESTDLAVLRVAQVPPGTAPLLLGRSAELAVGDPLVAIGNPFGLERSATTGIVSGLKRVINAPNSFAIQNVIQTDAAINQGNSGGPLLDRRGRVVGINSQITSESGGNDGVGFAVPIDTIRPVVDSILATGEARHAWLGVTGRQITPEMARRLGVPEARGVAVMEVDPRSPAHAAGLRPARSREAEVPEGADLIVAVDGRPVRDMADVSRAVSARAVGARLEVGVLRAERRVDLAITLADRPGDVGVARP